MSACSRCGTKINSYSWEDGWPNYGTITLGYSSQIFGALGGADNIARDRDFDLWKRKPEPITTFDAQKITLEWTDKTPYRLCRSCQRTLIALIGEFFGWNQ